MCSMCDITETHDCFHRSNHLYLRTACMRFLCIHTSRFSFDKRHYVSSKKRTTKLIDFFQPK